MTTITYRAKATDKLSGLMTAEVRTIAKPTAKHPQGGVWTTDGRFIPGARIVSGL